MDTNRLMCLNLTMESGPAAGRRRGLAGLLTTGLALIALMLATPPLPAMAAEPQRAAATDTLRLAPAAGEKSDTTEYELVIMDPAFDLWFERVREPEGMYTQEYLENWNRQLVIQWNASLGRSGRAGCTPETYIDYQPDVDYGKELNYKLYYYFRYFHQQCRLFHNTPSRW